MPFQILNLRSDLQFHLVVLANAVKLVSKGSKRISLMYGVILGKIILFEEKLYSFYETIHSISICTHTYTLEVMKFIA